MTTIDLSISDFISEHPCLQTPVDMKNLCHPLHRIGITYFGHLKVCADGNVSGVSSNAPYFDAYMRNKYFMRGLHHNPLIKSLDYVCCDLLIRDKISEEFYYTARHFNVFHLFSIIKHEETETHVYHFAVDSYQNSIYEYYIKHRDLLEKFILYYQDNLKTSDFLNKAHQVYFPNEKVIYNPDVPYEKTNILTQEDVENYLKELSHHDSELIYNTPKKVDLFSLRERQCLHLWSKGSTAKTIARSLNLSPRTVYFYIENIRKKTGIHRKSDLAAYYWATPELMLD